MSDATPPELTSGQTPSRPGKLALSMTSLIVMSIAIGLISLAIYGLFLRDNTFFGGSSGGSTLLEWKDLPSGVRASVRTSPTLVKTNSHLFLEVAGKTANVLIDDDATWGTIQFVRFEDWFLVLNDQYPMAGYNFKTSAIYGEGDWDKLPRDVTTGTVVASKKIGECSLPANYPAK